MKTLQTVLLIITSTILYNCSSQTESKTEASNPSEAEETTEVQEVSESPAVCIWDKILVRETPSQKGKFVTTLSIGESLFYLGQDTTVEERSYAYVKLNDGQIGWALKDFIVNDARAAVVLTDMNLYSRPDLLTKTDKVFKMMDIISSIEDQGEWMKIKGRRSGAKWMDEGWIKSSNISFDAVDIAVAKFTLQALANEDEDKKIESLQEITSNGDLSSSKFIDEVQGFIDELTPEEEDLQEASAVDTTQATEETVPTDSID